MGEETDVAFAIRKGVQIETCAIYPNCYSAQVCLAHTFPIWCIVNHEMDPLAYLDGGGGRFAAPYVTLSVSKLLA